MRTLPALTGDQLSALSQHAFHWSAASLSLEPVSGQTPHFSRATSVAALDSTGTSRTLVAGQEAWEWRDLDGDSVRESAGLLLGASDLLWWDFLLHPTALTLYVRFVQPASFPAAGKGLLYLGNDAGTGARIYLDSTGTQYRLTYTDGATTRTSTLTGTAPTAGQRAELRGTLSSAGVIQLYQTINEGAETSAAAAAALALPAAWSDARLYLNSRGGGNVGAAFYRDATVAQGAPPVTDLRSLV